VFCGVLQSVAACYSGAIFCSLMSDENVELVALFTARLVPSVGCIVLHIVAQFCSVLQCCSMLHRDAR